MNPANGQETLAAHTEMLYDETALNPWYGTVTGWADPGTYRGNQTKVKRWRDRPTSIYLETRAEFDQVGNVTKSIDALGRTTTITYSPTFAFALATSATSPVPDPTAQYGSATALATFMNYDLSTGLITSTTDANNKTTTYEYNDPLDRLTRVNFPDGGRTTHIYVDVHQCGPYRESRTLLNSSGQESSFFAFFDGLGRSVRTFITDPQDSTKPYRLRILEYDATRPVLESVQPIPLKWLYRDDQPCRAMDRNHI